MIIETTEQMAKQSGILLGVPSFAVRLFYGAEEIFARTYTCFNVAIKLFVGQNMDFTPNKNTGKICYVVFNL